MNQSPFLLFDRMLADLTVRLVNVHPEALDDLIGEPASELGCDTWRTTR